MPAACFWEGVYVCTRANQTLPNKYISINSHLASTFSCLISTFPDNNILIIRRRATQARLSHRQNTWSKSLFPAELPAVCPGVALSVCMCVPCAHKFFSLGLATQSLRPWFNFFFFFLSHRHRCPISTRFHRNFDVKFSLRCDFANLTMLRNKQQCEWTFRVWTFRAFKCAIELDASLTFSIRRVINYVPLFCSTTVVIRSA